ncbi:hypothetical protein C8Q75DRAFT_803578 [Abortiporus biennis]|nr:hypothetical protein C8Q75DRAFT_803578 [Abortiporus biennis]
MSEVTPLLKPSTPLADTPVIPQRQMFINYDILLLIIDFIQFPSDILHILTTCKVVYRLGLPKLLRCPLRLVDEDSLKLKGFISFMTEYPQHFQHIKDLSLGAAKSDIPTLWEFTTEVLCKGTKLQCLDLSLVHVANSSAWIDIAYYRRSSIPNSITHTYHCQTLQHLGLHNLGYFYVTQILHGLHAPLKSIFIKPMPQHMRIGIRLATEPAIYLLQKFALTLEEIQLENERWPESHTPLPTKFPRVHTLVLRKTSLNGLENILHAFPNLKHFQYPGLCQLPVSRHRSTNLSIMEQLCQSGNMWKSPLKTLRISSHALYGFALQCQVDCLIVDTRLPSSYYEVNSMDNLHHIISDIQPPQLKITMSTVLSKSIILHKPESAEFYNIFSYPALAKLHMVVFLPFESLEANLECFIVEFLNALERNKHNKICWLGLGFNWEAENNNVNTYDVAHIDTSRVAIRLASAAGSSVTILVLYFKEKLGENRYKTWMHEWKVEVGDEWVSKPIRVQDEWP